MTGTSYNLLLACAAMVGALFVSAMILLARADGSRRELRTAITQGAPVGTVRYRRLVARVEQWPIVQRISTELIAAGLTIGALEFVAVSITASLAVSYTVAIVVSKTLGWLLIGIGARGCWAWVAVAKKKRTETLVAQLPALSRMLANSANAGLSLAAGLRLAAEELEDPLASELWLTSERLHYGQSIEDALADMARRLPTPELRVMIATLIIQHRRGGEIVGSLRDMSATLEARKVLRGEVRTMMAGPLFTGYATMSLGVVSLLMLNTMSPGAVELMFSRWPGRIALAVSFGLFAVGGSLIRRATRVAL